MEAGVDNNAQVLDQRCGAEVTLLYGDSQSARGLLDELN